MKKLIIYVFFLLAVISNASTLMAGNCYSDTIVKRWIEERDRMEEHVVQVWAKGANPEEYASEVAVISANELYIISKCREENEFLKNNLHILGKSSEPNVETVPAMILERLVGHDILSPWKQFPLNKRREVTQK